jgi:hypothetical protein
MNIVKSLLLFLVVFPFVLHAQTGIITTICGNGTNVDAGDGGLAISAKIKGAACGVFDKFGNYFFTEESHRIRKISPSGAIITVAGTGTGGYNGDGILAVTAQLDNPENTATDTFGNLFIADAKNHRLRKVDKSTGQLAIVLMGFLLQPL